MKITVSVVESGSMVDPGSPFTCALCGDRVPVGGHRYRPDSTPELSFCSVRCAESHVPYVQVDRFTRRFFYAYADAVSLHDFAVRSGHVAILRPGQAAARLAVIVVKAAGWRKVDA